MLARLDFAAYIRPDGFTLGGIQINGVRTFDPKFQGWTTPDAYAGDIHDPVSQQKYMWNRGNPIEYSDPSGFIVCLAPECVAARNKANAEIVKWLVPDLRPLFDRHASGQAKIQSALQLLMANTPGGRIKGKAVEIVSGIVTESGFLRTAEKWLGAGYRDMGNGRFLSSDGLRQIRFGTHETKDLNMLHAHYEAYDKPAGTGGKVSETATVDIVRDKP